MNRFANEKILAPIDFSDEADRAVDVALEIAGSPSHVTAIHVAPPILTFATKLNSTRSSLRTRSSRNWPAT